MEDNTHTSKQAYVCQPHPSQTTYKPHETKRPQPTINRLYETKVPCGAAYIIWPWKAVSLNICACQYCTPTIPNTFSTDHAPPRNTTFVCVVVLFVVDPLLQQYRTIHGTTHEVLLCCDLFLIAQAAVFAQGCAFETPHNSALVSIRIAQVGVSAQGCGNKEGSK